ncbi:hypothetical protein ONZ45_g2515 [Pleurotus djamor]|nr:hypothetical protein ONZ45_g2515 [Pleurotus djamor]
MGSMFSQLQNAFPPKSKFSVNDVPDLTGKVIIVTGSNTGIGKEIAKGLLSHNAKVYIAARNKEKSEAAIRDLKAATGNEAYFLQLDLANLKSIKQTVAEFLKKETQLHVLFNNGGLGLPPIEQITADGYDLTFGTNVLGPFYLTSLLLPTMIETAKQTGQPSRVVNTSSSAAEFVKGIDYEALKDGPARIKAGVNQMYFQSKFANLVHGIELSRRYSDQGIVSCALNPGNIISDFQRNWNPFLRLLTSVALYPTPKGALTPLYAGTTASAESINGQWIQPWARIVKMYPPRC